MRLLHVVPRYGTAVAGGAETAARRLAEELVGRGHHVEVLTSRAVDYVTWADAAPAGRTEEAGVVVHRLGIDAPRRPERFGHLAARVLTDGPAPPHHLQHRFLREQGPVLPGLRPWLRDRAAGFDVVVFHTYLYATTLEGLPAAAGRAPTLLHPAAHDEAPFRLTVLDAVLPLIDGIMFHTSEEAALYRRRFPTARPAAATVGLGIDPPDPAPDVAGFRRRYGLGDDPYLLVLGRLDPPKGTQEAFEYWRAYADRHEHAPRLVLMGQQVGEPPRHDMVVTTGFVDATTKAAALAGATALMVPSYFESFSIVLAEAWSYGTPALVQGSNEVLAGQAHRSRGAVPYSGYASFEAVLEELLADEGIRRRIGAAGRAYVDEHYRWPVVLERYEALLAATVAHRPGGDPRPIACE